MRVSNYKQDCVYKINSYKKIIILKEQVENFEKPANCKFYLHNLIVKHCDICH